MMPPGFPLLFSLTSIVGWAFVLAVLFDRAELFMVAVPLIVALLSTRRATDPKGLAVATQVSTERLCEGERLSLTVTLRASAPMPLLELHVPLPDNFTRAAGDHHAVLALKAGEERIHRFELTAHARGSCHLGDVYLRSHDRSGLRAADRIDAGQLPVHVYPQLPAIRRPPRPLRMRSSFGNYVSPRVGEGLEPGNVRPFMAGDRVRHINWRTSLRLGRLYVSQFHEERNADVVLLLDTFAESGLRPNSSLDVSVRAAGALAAAYLARKDRVGLIEVGGQIRWIKPASGRRHLESVIEAVLPADVMFTYVSKNLDFLSTRILPPQALIIAITPLLDERFTRIACDLAARKFDILVLAISPVDLTVRTQPETALNSLTGRLWQQEWQARVRALRRQGLAVIDWNPDTPLAGALDPWSRRPAQWNSAS
jgi:uncharacterized protein (DUF58 family)